MTTKLIYLHQYFNTPDMAGGTRSYEMARRLVNNGFEVHMVTSATDPANKQRGWSYSNIEGIHVHKIFVAYDNNMSYIYRVMAFIKFSVLSSIKTVKLDGDVIFATSTPLTIAFPAIACKTIRRIPMVFEVRDLWPELPHAIGALTNPLLLYFARRLEKFAYLSSKMVVGLSPTMCEGVIAQGIPAEKVVCIPNSCDFDKFDVPPERGRQIRSGLPWLDDRPLVIYAGTLGRINGVGYMVDIAKAMLKVNKEVRFLILGEGYEKDAITQKAKDARVLNYNLFMLNHVPKEKMPDYLSAATICCSFFIPLKEMEANSANKFFDALAAGKPLFINYGGWQKELIEEQNIGLASTNVDLNVTVQQLASLLANTDRLAECGENSKRLGKKRFSRDDLSKEMQNVLELALVPD